jgi:hypothetical protein
MSLDKAIAAGKEHRKWHRRGARFDRTCRTGGSCKVCSGNRQIQKTRARERGRDGLKDRE